LILDPQGLIRFADAFQPKPLQSIPLRTTVTDLHPTGNSSSAVRIGFIHSGPLFD